MLINNDSNFSLEKSMEILEKTPLILMEALQNLSNSWIFSNEGRNTWSPYDVLGHFLHGDEVDWVPRIKIILSNDENKTFETFDRFAQFEKNKNKSMNQMLQEFKELRKIKIDELKKLNINNENLSLKGIHPELGEVTLQQLIATWVVHDLSHLAHILRIIANQYKSEVGPWIEYLKILN